MEVTQSARLFPQPGEILFPPFSGNVDAAVHRLMNWLQGCCEMACGSGRNLTNKVQPGQQDFEYHSRAYKNHPTFHLCMYCMLTWDESTRWRGTLSNDIIYTISLTRLWIFLIKSTYLIIGTNWRAACIHALHVSRSEARMVPSRVHTYFIVVLLLHCCRAGVCDRIIDGWG